MVCRRRAAARAEKHEFRLHEGRKQDRLTLGVTAKPFANMTYAIDHESPIFAVQKCPALTSRLYPSKGILALPQSTHYTT